MTRRLRMRSGSRRLAEGARLRQDRIVRDYGMYDRRENPQYYPEVPQVD